MTEKRFIIDNESDIIEFDCDTNEYIDDFMWGDGKGWNRICNRLNELYDENQKLKQENKLLEIEDERWTKAFHEDAETINRLNAKNEQLRKENQELKLIIQQNEFAKKEFEKDNFTWDNPIMYDKENERFRCIPIPYKREVKNMTDKFKLVKSEPYIENIETGECYDLDSDNFSYIVKVMNDLSNENEKLKQENERLVQSLFFANNQEKWEQKINNTK